MATPRRAGGSVSMRRPLSLIAPLLTPSNPAIMRKEEVLPQPEEPSSAMVSPSATSRSSDLTAATEGLPKRR